MNRTSMASWVLAELTVGILTWAGMIDPHRPMTADKWILFVIILAGSGVGIGVIIGLGDLVSEFHAPPDPHAQLLNNIRAARRVQATQGLAELPLCYQKLEEQYRQHYGRNPV